MRRISGALRRGALVGAVAAAVAVPVTGAQASQGPAPAAAPAPGSAAPAGLSTLDARYRAARQDIQAALRAAERGDDPTRTRALRELAAPERQFLSFDARGAGRAVEVLGDLAHADRVAVLVPGADTTLDRFDTRGGTPWAAPGGGARALLAQARETGGPGARTAVVAWLGYRTPNTISASVITPGRADDGARELRALVTELRRAAPGAGIALLCHSYGSVVCGRAAPGLPVADIALFGSPGTGARTVAGLATNARVWAGRASGDAIANVPHVSFPLPLGTTLGLGTDPVAPAFGARVFAAGDGGHGDYLRPGSVPLRNLALIALGRAPEEVRSHG
ncbi:alpha/beta hydrolase [Streptomyces sp. URMC 123]|uniref:alpha/beta hydrolase n=1 Tax=Streptomyces sp. URMC 123 TaxID=3423403 RepID=UPI003F1DD64D